MYDILKLSNFRGFREFTIDLKPITLISGENNTGKTTILESIFLLHHYANPHVFFQLLGFRGARKLNISPQTIWEPLFYRKDMGKILKIEMGVATSIQIEKNNRYTLPKDISNELNVIMGASTINYALSCILKKDDRLFKGEYTIGNNVMLVGQKETDQPFATAFVQYAGPNYALGDDDLIEWFGKVDLMGKKQRLLECLKILDDSITDITTIMIDGIAQLYITDKQNIKMPLLVMGDGIRKIMNVVLTLLANPSSVLLLDEIENGLHYSLYAKFWALIASLAVQEKCQIIAATHSYECIGGALEGVKSTGLCDVFTYVRLDRDDERIEPKAFTCDMLEFALASDLEIR